VHWNSALLASFDKPVLDCDGVVFVRVCSGLVIFMMAPSGQPESAEPESYVRLPDFCSARWGVPAAREEGQ